MKDLIARYEEMHGLAAELAAPWVVVGRASRTGLSLVRSVDQLLVQVDAVAWTGQAQWLLVLWGYWVDRHRTPRPHF